MWILLTHVWTESEVSSKGGSNSGFIYFSWPAVEIRWSHAQFLMTEKTDPCHRDAMKLNGCQNAYCLPQLTVFEMSISGCSNHQPVMWVQRTFHKLKTLLKANATHTTESCNICSCGLTISYINLSTLCNQYCMSAVDHFLAESFDTHDWQCSVPESVMWPSGWMQPHVEVLSAFSVEKQELRWRSLPRPSTTWGPPRWRETRWISTCSGDVWSW